jgi:hypothetical protein
MLPEGMRFPDNISVSFTRSGTALQIAIAPPAEDTVPADSLAGKARFDLWHWKDPVLQPTQLLQVNQARNRTYTAIYTLATKKLIQLTTDSFPSVQLSDDAKIGMQSTSVPYDIERMWGDGGNDIYQVTRDRRGSSSRRSHRDACLFLAAVHRHFDQATGLYNVATGRPRTSATAPACTSSRRRGARPAIPRHGASPDGRRTIARCSSTIGSTSGNWTQPG